MEIGVPGWVSPDSGHLSLSLPLVLGLSHPSHPSHPGKLPAGYSPQPPFQPLGATLRQTKTHTTTATLSY